MPFPKSEQADQLEQEIFSFGREILSDVRKHQGMGDKIEGKLFDLLLRNPNLKAALFRLVDVLPTLRSDENLVVHIKEYLAPVFLRGSAMFRFLLKIGCDTQFKTLTARIARSVVRRAAGKFIAGEDAHSARQNLLKLRRKSLAFTVDLLGEYSVGESEALHYLDRYKQALSTLSNMSKQLKISDQTLMLHSGEHSSVCISVKLSALYSQCDILNYSKSIEVLSERLTQIALQAQSVGATLYVDAEDSATNKLIYPTFRQVFAQKELRQFPYPGIVVQAYSHESPKIVSQLIAYAKNQARPIAIRLVKGAYWDSETIIAQQNSLPSPLFKFKASSDANYELLSKTLIDNIEYVYPAFGSHNIRSLAHACCYAKFRGISSSNFEIQMLYGMADPIAETFKNHGYLVRMYMALGELIPGMGYFVRRLLENTSNQSFLRSFAVAPQAWARLLAKPEMAE